MFNHSDTLETSSWHGTVLGTKWWYVCKGECFESYVEPGEVLYYGAGWSHETQNLVTPTLTLTGTVVHEWNYRTVANRLHSECSASSLNFLFSAQLCDALDKCYDHWHEHVRLRRLATFFTAYNRRQPRCRAGFAISCWRLRACSMWYLCPQYAKSPRPDGLWNPWRTIGTFPPPPHKLWAREN